MEMAERLGGSRAMLVALEGRHFALARPENLEERLEIARRIIALADEAGDRERDLLGRYFLIADLVEADEMEAAGREIEVYGRMAEEARLPLHRWYHARFRAMQALLEGRLDEAAGLAQRAFELGHPVEPRTATMHFGAQQWLLGNLRGQLAGLEEAVRAFVADYPRVAAWRVGLVTVLLAQGRVDEAEEAFREFTESGFENVPRDAIWSMTMGICAEVLSAGVGTPEDARALYRLVAPYADRNAVTGEVILCGGPMALYAGIGALIAGEVETAIAHLEDALERSARMGARPFEGAAAQALAQALAARGADGDAERAAELGARAESLAGALAGQSPEAAAA